MINIIWNIIQKERNSLPTADILLYFKAKSILEAVKKYY